MILSNLDIADYIKKGEICIEPFEVNLLRSANVCLRLGTEFIYFDSFKPIDLKRKESYPDYQLTIASKDEGILLPPRTMILSNTLEKISLSRKVAGWISNLSGLARLGLKIVMSNYISPGYGEAALNSLTLELYNTLDVPIRVYPGMRACHIIFFRLLNSSSLSYDSQVGTYSKQNSPRESLFFEEFNN